MSLRWKLLITNLAVALTAIAILGGYVEHTLRGRALAERRAGLARSAALAREIAGGAIARGDLAAADATAKRLFRETGYRFTFVDRTGKVLGDGEHDPRTMVNHAGRPEVTEALRGRIGSTLRHSETLGTDMLYVAVPARQGVVRVAVPLTEIDAALVRTRTALAAVIVLAVLLSLLISAKVSDRIAGPIQELRARATRMAAGDLDQRVANASSDEIGDLARAFGLMAGQVKTMLATVTEERNKIRAIFAGMSDGILVVDPAGKVTLANGAARSMLGLGDSASAERSLIELTRNHEIDGAASEAASTRQPQRRQITLPLADERTLSLLATPVTDESGELLATVILLHDITEIRRLERVRRDFVASASHELRTPITSIRVMAESLRAGAEEDPALREQFVSAILDSSNRLAALVDDLLTLSQLEHPATILHKEPVAVRALVDRVIPLFSHRASQKGLALRVEIPEDLTVMADPDLTDHALTNLLDNAIKYTPSGSVEVWAEPADGRQVRIEVKDTGTGIPSQHLPRIFERFYRVDKARSRELGGTGLGLSIVKHVAEEHGGSVEVTSELGHGSTFSLKLPAA